MCGILGPQARETVEITRVEGRVEECGGWATKGNSALDLPPLIFELPKKKGGRQRCLPGLPCAVLPLCCVVLGPLGCPGARCVFSRCAHAGWVPFWLVQK